jgi:hypothetical protein
MLKMHSTATLVAIAASALLSLSACAPAAESNTSTNSPDAKPTPAASATATASPKTFTMPTDCAGILPQSRFDSFAADGLVLLGGPGGKYGQDYLADPTPEEAAGGITCIWGHDDANRLSTFTVSVAPLDGGNRSSVVENLLEQGLNQGTRGKTNTFSQEGDGSREPAILNVLHSDSWVSVISTVGGPALAEEAQKIADEVASVVYT